MKPLYLLAFTLFLPFFSWSAKWADFSVEYDQPAGLNYGTEINFRFYVTNKKGEKELLRRSQTDHLKATVTNCEFSLYTQSDNVSVGGRLVLFTRPKTINDTVAEVEFTLEKDDQVFKRSFRFRINYKCPVKISFRGFEGKRGSTYEKGREAITHWSGNNGENGGNGDNGKDIVATFLKMNSGFPDSFYVCRIITVNDNFSFEYFIKNPNEPIVIDCRGGDGGNGGNGSNGTKRNRYRVDGGNGGNGGTGGNGGSVSIKIKNASEIKSSITCLNTGGKGGKAGMAGKGVPHKSGDPELNGKDGVNGLQGMAGEDGAEPAFIAD